MHTKFQLMPIPVAVWYEAWVCGRSCAGNVGVNPAKGWMTVVCVTCCQGQSLFQNSPTKCICILECDQM